MLALPHETGRTSKCICVSLIMWQSSHAYREGRRRPRLDVDAPVELEAALGDELSLELDQAAEAEQSLDVLFAIERAEHAGEVVRRGDLGAEAAAKWLALCAAA